MLDQSVFLIFIDGLGIGKRDESNPLFTVEGVSPLAYFDDQDGPVYGNGVLVRTDPRLGVDGRPQSASGQTSILTGTNAPQLLGYHKQGFPNRQLRDVIAERSVFKQLASLGVGPNAFANTFMPGFFTKPPRWKSASTCSVEAAEIPFFRLPDLVGRKSLFHDFTNRRLIDAGFDVPEFSPFGAASIAADLTRRYRFVFYEHFITDMIGHSRDREAARHHLPLLAEFVRECIAAIDLERTTIILTSDHGNIEDLSVRNHTLNDVPTVVWGRDGNETASVIKDLTDITPSIIRLLTNE